MKVHSIDESVDVLRLFIVVTSSSLWIDAKPLESSGYNFAIASKKRAIFTDFNEGTEALVKGKSGLLCS